MTKLWLTSDLHFGHKNIIKYCKRPFKTLEEMDKRLIKNWNERVKKDDMVIVIGDFCFKNSAGGKEGEGTTKNYKHYSEQLNGNIVFIRGNHDRNNSVKTRIKSLVFEYGGLEYFCTHRPEDRNPYYSINLVGHVHNAWKNKIAELHCLLINVGVDVNNFRPVSMEEITKEINGVRKEVNYDK